MGLQGENMDQYCTYSFTFVLTSHFDCVTWPPALALQHFHNASRVQVVNKDTLKKPRHKAKLESEIKIHMKLKHPHVVYLHDAFEDKDNVYLLMELCEAQTLLELVKRKKRLADCVSYF